MHREIHLRVIFEDDQRIRIRAFPVVETAGANDIDDPFAIKIDANRRIRVGQIADAMEAE